MLHHSNINLPIQILMLLDSRWSNPRTIKSKLLNQTGNISAPMFVRAVQSLSDLGLLSYELFRTGAQSKTVYHDSIITAKGRDYLYNHAEFAALEMEA